MSFNYSNLLSSALPNFIRCSANCGATQPTMGPNADTDEATVVILRDRGWQVLDGQWTCPVDLPAERRNLPGAMGRRPNPFCDRCGDDRGGAYGHQGFECTWEAA